MEDGNPNKISQYNDRLIWANDLKERTEILIESSPNIFVLPGKQGTFLEFLLADEQSRLSKISNESLKKNEKVFFLDVFWMFF